MTDNYKDVVSNRNILKGPKRKPPANLAGEKIRNTLKIYEMSTQEVAKEIGITRNNFAKYVLGQKTPTMQTAVKIKKYFEKNFNDCVINCEDWLSPVSNIKRE